VGKKPINAKVIARAVMKSKGKIGKALEDAGYAKSTARSKSGEIMARPDVQEEFTKLADRAGLTTELLIKKHVELLNAKRTVSAVSGKDAGAGTVDFIEVDDYQTQCKAVDMGYKVKGHFIEKSKVELSGTLTEKIEVSIKLVKPRSGK
jgi:hypothetical protein